MAHDPARGPADLVVAEAERHLLDADADTGLVLQDRSGAIVSANEAAEGILGLTFAQMQGRTSADPRWAVIDADGVFLPGDRQPAMRALATGLPVRGFTMGVHRPSVDRIGEHVWISVSSEPLYRSADESAYAVITSFSVIGGRAGEHLRLRESERRFRMIAEQSSDLVTVLSLDATHVWVSPSYHRVTGYTADELIGHRLQEFVHQDDVPHVAAALAGGSERGVLPRVTVRLLHADGHVVFLESSARIILDAQGKPCQIVAISRDVTERVLAEQARAEALAELRTVMDHAPIGMAVVDAQGYWVQVNHALCDLLGYSSDELHRMTFSELTHPDDVGSTADQFSRMLSGEITVCSAEKRYLRADGETVWVMRTASRVPGRAGRPPLFVAQLLDITERKKAQATLAELAVTDPLTGLPNRLVLTDRLSHALAVARRDGLRVGVIFCDLDWFKQVNDTLGHEAGDELLRLVAVRLRATVREEDTAVRLGGDEFVVVCENVTDPLQVRRLAERIHAAVEAPYMLTGGHAELSISIGIAVGDGPTPEDLLQQADASMLRVKRSGRAGIDVYDAAAQASAADRVALHRELGKALAEGQLVLFYQPIISLRTGQVIAREALLRWRHPVRGLVPPDLFLPAAEQSRQIIDIGAWVLSRACADAAGWRDGAAVAVNVSARHLATSGFADGVRAALAASELPVSQLCLEITESSVLNASPSTLKSTRALTELGVSLGLDDFGTGQSSITALHRLPIQTLKIDRSFVADLPDSRHAANLVDGLIRLGAGMGIDVVAEGIENADQAAWLTVHQCPLAQGFLFGRPAPMRAG